MWFVIIMCAAGVDCGLMAPIAKQIQPGNDCRSVGELAISLARYDRTKFKVVCAKSED